MCENSQEKEKKKKEKKIYNKLKNKWKIKKISIFLFLVWIKRNGCNKD
jgi:hypothetical protein